MSSTFHNPPSIPTTPTDGPQDKTKKYDRQLRLWGDHGQAALESAKVCLINATATGTEILKNLILPGVGYFTVVDEHKVSGEDVGNNFFLDRRNIGQSRAQATTEFLQELNEDVEGDFIEESVDNLLDDNQNFFTNFRLVIATNLREKPLLRLASTLWESEIPLLICRSYGFIGYIRLVTKEHTVIESHPSNYFEDLRLDRPFPGLVEFCDSLDLDIMSNKEHSHTPWLVLIYKYLQAWKEEHSGGMPKTSKEKNELKDMIRGGIRRKDEMDAAGENFEEAVKHVNTALLPSSIPPEIKTIFEDDACVNLNSESKPFWILGRALKNFVDQDGGGLLPLRGTIPDMTADSERYIQLQNVYRHQASEDVAIVSSHVEQLLQSLGRDEPLSIQKIRQSPSSSPGKPQDHISEDEIRTFCKNASFLRVIRCRSLAAEYDATSANITVLASRLDGSGEPDDLVYYIMLRAVDKFYSEFNRYPGTDEASFEIDIPHLKGCVIKLMQEWGLSQSIRDEFVQEMCRYGASELHTVAGFIGGTAAQEAIKIITGQFIPINNTFIYNAMNQTSLTFDL